LGQDDDTELNALIRSVMIADVLATRYVCHSGR
jgi:hypothetical protein